MEFSILADSLNKMESTRKRLELTEYLVELFEKTPKEVISKIIYLLQGKLRPDFEGIELGVAEKLAIRAISKSSGIEIKKIENEYRKKGDLGYAVGDGSGYYRIFETVDGGNTWQYNYIELEEMEGKAQSVDLVCEDSSCSSFLHLYQGWPTNDYTGVYKKTLPLNTGWHDPEVVDTQRR